MFQEEAEHWWETVKDEAKFSGEEVNWNFPIKKFNGKYILNVVNDHLALEFQELKQGHMSVTQSDVRFTQLSRYAGRLIREEAEKV